MSCLSESVLRTKISGRLKLLRGKDVTTYIYSVFLRPNTGICDGNRQMMCLFFCLLCIKQRDGPVRVHSLKYLYPLKLSLSPVIEVESGIDSPPLSFSFATLGKDAYSGTPSRDETNVWLCPVCNAPQGDMDMIGCDPCDEWFHFMCVRTDRPPLERQKWYCPERALQKRQCGRTSLLLA